MKRIKIYVGLLLALTLLLTLLVTPCAQAADMEEGSYYAIGYLHPGGATIWAYGYYLYGRQTVYATMRVNDYQWYCNYIHWGATIHYPNGSIAVWSNYQGGLYKGMTISSSMLNPPSGGYVNFDVATRMCFGPDYCIPLGGDLYYWYYPV